MNVLVVGGGGREHALCWSLGASPLVDALYCAPGNGGIAEHARPVDIEVMDFDGLLGFCRSEAIEFVVVGPEAPLVAGLVDRLEAAGIKAFGPSAAAAEIEGSKSFAKELCRKYAIPTADYAVFTDADAAKAHVEAHIEAKGAPIVVKADGLAAGKGVTVAETVEAALAAVDEAFAGRFGEAGNALVIEDFLVGEEASFHVLVDGEHVVALASAQDHKAVHDGDRGPNTGGMGAYSPAPVVDAAMADQIMTRIVAPTVAAMRAEGRPYKGVLYCGLMIGPDGPQVVEFNCRFGDPECQVILARLTSDLLPALLAAADGTLDRVDLGWYDDPALSVVIAANGYPGPYDKDSAIGNLGPAGELPGITIFHAGTRLDDGRVLANGGRVLNVTARGSSVAEAKARAYEAVDVIDWPEGFCRRDIGWRAVARESGRETA